MKACNRRAENRDTILPVYRGPTHVKRIFIKRIVLRFNHWSYLSLILEFEKQILRSKWSKKFYISKIPFNFMTSFHISILASKPKYVLIILKIITLMIIVHRKKNMKNQSYVSTLYFQYLSQWDMLVFACTHVIKYSVTVNTLMF